MTLARSARWGLALAAQTRSAAVRLKAMVSGCWAPSRTADMASTSAQVLKRNSRISSRTGMSRSMVRNFDRVLDGQRLALLDLLRHADELEVACLAVRNLARNFSNSS